MSRRTLTAIQVQRRNTRDARAFNPTMHGWHTLAYCEAADADAELARQRARFGDHAHTLDFRTREKNPAHAHVPAQTVALGFALDLTTQFRDTRTTWDFEIKEWHMLTDAAAMDMPPGKAALYLVRASALEDDREHNAREQFRDEDHRRMVAALDRTLKRMRAMAASVRSGEPFDPDAWVKLRNAAEQFTWKLRTWNDDRTEATAAAIEAFAINVAIDEGAAARATKRAHERAALTDQIRDRDREQRLRNPSHDLDEHPRAAETYDRWHEREPERVTVIDDIPDLIGVYVGRALRIGYRSDKWHARGTTIDYEHDFTEGTHTAPECWADCADLSQAHALVIVGGDMAITEEGID